MRRIAYDEIDSTNTEALRRIAAGDISGLTLITAARQTAGKGRLGRNWSSPTGNFHGSFVVPKDDRAEWRRPWLLGAIAALSVAEMLDGSIEDGAEIRVKWPNDVLVAGAKISGLLLEASGASPFLVLGIGINVASSPEGTPYPTTSIDRHRSAPAGVEAVAQSLSAILAEKIEGWLDKGFAALRPAYLSRTHRPGDAMSVQLGERRVSGRFLDIDADGFLLIEVDGKAVQVSAGDVLAGRG